MHWSRVKTILILLFLVIDIVLLSSIILTSYTDKTIDDTTINDTVSILARSNIKLEPSVIPKTIKTMGVVELKNEWTDNEKAATVLMGAAPSVIEETYVSDTKQTFFLGKEFYFTNSSPTPTVKSKEDYKTALESMGIYTDEQFIYLMENAFSAVQAIDGNVIFETSVSASIGENGGISSVNGYFILFSSQSSVSKKATSSLMPITSVLINFLQDPYLPQECMEITSIETGYSLGNIYRDTKHKLVSVIPAYKISASNGNFYMYDALTGDFLYANINNEILY